MNDGGNAWEYFEWRLVPQASNILFHDPTFRRALQPQNSNPIEETVPLRFDSAAAIMATTVDKVRLLAHV